MNTRGTTVPVTGGASGIVLAIAQAFSELGNRVLICGRSPEKLDAAKCTLEPMLGFNNPENMGADNRT